MDDELELNIAAPAPPKPRKPPVAAPNAGGAKRAGDTTKPAAAQQTGGAATAAGQQRTQGKGPGGPNKGYGDVGNGSAGRSGGDRPAGGAKGGQRQDGGRDWKQQKTGAGGGKAPGGFKRAGGGKSMDPEDPESLLRPADDDEEGDVMAALGLVASKEAKLRAEMEAVGRAPAAEREGVVDFDDDGEDGPRGKKRRTAGPGSTSGPGGPSTGPGSGGAIKATGRGNFTPGSLTHAAAAANAMAAGADAAAGWAQLGLAGSLVGQLETLGFASPTPIQRKVLPVLLAGRDCLVKAQTGSGKTLCYLLPIINDLQSHQPRISRGEGTHAIVLAPTRELCIQVSDVACALLKRYHWLVAGLLIGGENRAHEKARLRKGVTLLAASPGRLLDHLQSTAAFRTTELRWLVLDEADRLLDLGFEAKLRQIVDQINKRSSGAAPEGRGPGGSSTAAKVPKPTATAKVEEADPEDEDEEGGAQGGRGGRAGPGPGSAAAAGGGAGSGAAGERRQTVLLSATLHKQLGALTELAMRDPAVVGFDVEQTGKGGVRLVDGKPAPSGGAGGGGGEEAMATYTLPSTLRQTWIEVPAKERLVALAALLKSRTARRRVGGTKVVIFVSSCDGVEFLHHVLGDMWEAVAGSRLLPPACRLLKLHGDMLQAQRTETFAGFAKEGDGVLVCTDVAARGLDFPNVTCIIQYDVPGAPAEYVHRVGRSARMGAAGEAVLVLMPHEVPYVNLLRSRGVMLESESLDSLARWLPTPPEDALMSGGAGGKRAAKVARTAAEGAARQLAQHFHRTLSTAVSRDPHAAKLSNDAFRSYVRAYATHSGDIKRVFAVRNLHLGHVAHSFCQLETPTTLGNSGSQMDRKRRKREAAEAAQEQRRKKMKYAARRVTS
ncbi:hypothetical protein HYH03_011889 [Edaphochlamys debaryana]|uniref:ATP-dependent RNA helicase n=1 Tax=Edaphochlamys debaryana TaxID=47281 RepID=A0A836BW09_9CHLO|nr:hypothetical protein HYH03_011889 [Edaphochlamys debaryana]|eukprot:KAG2489609.1 hypothetical protein HYH03_011889 [Edaphochlamys debaryana]